MDPVVRRRLKEEVDALQRMRLVVDDLAGRVERLESRIGPSSFGIFSLGELRRQRLAAVLHARSQGLSVALIARVLGLSRHTVADILTDAESEPPAAVLGGDGRSYRSRRNGNGPAI